MIKRIRNLLRSELFRSGGVYTLTTIVEKAIPFLLLPVLTRYLTTKEYGTVSMFLVLVALTIPFMGINGQSAVLRSYYKKNIDFPTYLFNAILVLLGSSIVVFLIYRLFAEWISLYSGFPRQWLLYVVIVSVFQYFVNLILAVWQAQEQPLKYGGFRILLTSINLGLTIVLVVGFFMGWQGMVIGKIVSVVCMGAIGLAVLFKRNLVSFTFSWGYFRHIIKYGLPLIPHVVSGVLLTMMDRLFITNMVGIEATGMYTVGYQVGMIIGVIALAFNSAWVPWFYKKLNTDSDLHKRNIVKITYAYILIILCAAGVLTWLSPWFMQILVGEAFYGATKFIMWVTLGYAFNGMYLMVINYMFYVEKTSILAWLTLISVLVNAFFNYILIRKYGAIGAAMATTLSFAVQFLLTWILANRIYKMPWGLRSIKGTR